MLLLKAIERNWGLVGPGDWDKRSWKIHTNGWYEYKESYRSGSPDIPEIPDLVEEGALSTEQMNKLQDVLKQAWSDEVTEASDGNAWEFKLYEQDSVIKHRDLGSIDGIEPYESIASIVQGTKE